MKSIVSYPERGVGGKNSYRGNCSPKLIVDLIDQYKVDNMSDFMVGSGTTEDVCNKKGVKGQFLDLNRGFDLMNMDIPDRSDFIFWHPPYWDIIKYADSQYKASDVINKYGLDPRMADLSRKQSWEEFVKEMNYCMVKQYASLEKGGRMAVLMGDIKKRGRLYSMLCEIAKPGTLEQVVIKAQHNCMSYGNEYAGKFIPIVHEYLLIVRKDNTLTFNVMTAENKEYDMRDIKSSTWRDIIIEVVDSLGGKASLGEIYKEIDGHKRTKTNTNWQAKVRQVAQDERYFVRVGTGVYKLAA